MDEFLIRLDSTTARFYDRIARTVQLPTEQILQDALFKLAGELSLEALSKTNRYIAHCNPVKIWYNV